MRQRVLTGEKAMDRKEIANTPGEAEHPDEGMTRRELLKVGAGSMAGMALTGVPTFRQGTGDPQLPEEDLQRWFNTAAGMGAVRAGNIVGPLIDGRNAFSDMLTAMRSATGPGHYIYLLGWWLTDGFQLIP